MTPINHNSLFRRSLASIVAGSVLLTQAVFCHAQETNFWAERRQAVQRHRDLTAGPVSGGLQSPRQLAMTQLSQGALLGQEIVSRSWSPRALSPLPHPLFRQLSHLPEKDLLTRLVPLLTPFGVIQDFQRPASDTPPEKVVVLIQDVHGARSAQIHIAKMILNVLETFPDAPVGLEGAWGKFDLTPFRGGTDLSRRQAGNFFFNAGLIAGPDSVAFGAKKTPHLFGIDDPTLYRANVEAVRQSAPLRTLFSARVDALNRALEPWSAGLPPKARTLEAQAEAYAAGSLSLTAYVAALSKEGGPALAQQYPQLALFQKTVRAESSLNPTAVQYDRQRLLEKLVNRLSSEDLDPLLQVSLGAKSGSVSHVEYLRFLERLCQGAKVSLTQFPDFRDYLEYTLMAERIDPVALHREIEEAQESLFSSLFADEGVRNWHSLKRDILLLRKLLGFSLTTGEWGLYIQRREALRDMQERIKKLTGSAPSQEGWATQLGTFEGFYQAALGRNVSLASKTLEEPSLTRSPEAMPLCLVVAGGFHRDGLLDLWRKSPVSVLTVIPQMSSEDTGSAPDYLSVFTHPKTSLDDLFAAPKISLVATPEVSKPQGVVAGLAEPVIEALTWGKDVKNDRVEIRVTDDANFSQGSMSAPAGELGSQDKGPFLTLAPRRLSLGKKAAHLLSASFRVLSRVLTSRGGLVALVFVVAMVFSFDSFAADILVQGNDVTATVQAGDSLWKIAAQALQALGVDHATNAQIAPVWHSLLSANPGVGDHLRIGQVLNFQGGIESDLLQHLGHLAEAASHVDPVSTLSAGDLIPTGPVTADPLAHFGLAHLPSDVAPSAATLPIENPLSSVDSVPTGAPIDLAAPASPATAPTAFNGWSLALSALSLGTRLATSLLGGHTALLLWAGLIILFLGRAPLRRFLGRHPLEPLSANPTQSAGKPGGPWATMGEDLSLVKGVFYRLRESLRVMFGSASLTSEGPQRPMALASAFGVVELSTRFLDSTDRVNRILDVIEQSSRGDTSNLSIARRFFNSPDVDGTNRAWAMNFVSRTMPLLPFDLIRDLLSPFNFRPLQAPSGELALPLQGHRPEVVKGADTQNEEGSDTDRELQPELVEVADTLNRIHQDFKEDPKYLVRDIRVITNRQGTLAHDNGAADLDQSRLIFLSKDGVLSIHENVLFTLHSMDRVNQIQRENPGLQFPSWPSIEDLLKNLLRHEQHTLIQMENWDGQENLAVFLKRIHAEAEKVPGMSFSTIYDKFVEWMIGADPVIPDAAMGVAGFGMGNWVPLEKLDLASELEAREGRVDGLLSASLLQRLVLKRPSTLLEQKGVLNPLEPSTFSLLSRTGRTSALKVHVVTSPEWLENGRKFSLGTLRQDDKGVIHLIVPIELLDLDDDIIDEVLTVLWEQLALVVDQEKALGWARAESLHGRGEILDKAAQAVQKWAEGARRSPVKEPLTVPIFRSITPKVTPSATGHTPGLVNEEDQSPGSDGHDYPITAEKALSMTLPHLAAPPVSERREVGQAVVLSPSDHAGRLAQTLATHILSWPAHAGRVVMEGRTNEASLMARVLASHGIEVVWVDEAPLAVLADYVRRSPGQFDLLISGDTLLDERGIVIPPERIDSLHREAAQQKSFTYLAKLEQASHLKLLFKVSGAELLNQYVTSLRGRLSNEALSLALAPQFILDLRKLDVAQRQSYKDLFKSLGLLAGVMEEGKGRDLGERVAKTSAENRAQNKPPVLGLGIHANGHKIVFVDMDGHELPFWEFKLLLAKTGALDTDGLVLTPWDPQSVFRAAPSGSQETTAYRPSKRYPAPAWQGDVVACALAAASTYDGRSASLMTQDKVRSERSSSLRQIRLEIPAHQWSGLMKTFDDIQPEALGDQLAGAMPMTAGLYPINGGGRQLFALETAHAKLWLWPGTKGVKVRTENDGSFEGMKQAKQLEKASVSWVKKQLPSRRLGSAALGMMVFVMFEWALFGFGVVSVFHPDWVFNLTEPIVWLFENTFGFAAGLKTLVRIITVSTFLVMGEEVVFSVLRRWMVQRFALGRSHLFELHPMISQHPQVVLFDSPIHWLNRSFISQYAMSPQGDQWKETIEVHHAIRTLPGFLQVFLFSRDMRISQWSYRRSFSGPTVFSTFLRTLVGYTFLRPLGLLRALGDLTFYVIRKLLPFGRRQGKKEQPVSVEIPLFDPDVLVQGRISAVDGLKEKTADELLGFEARILRFKTQGEGGKTMTRDEVFLAGATGSWIPLSQILEDEDSAHVVITPFQAKGETATALEVLPETVPVFQPEGPATLAPTADHDLPAPSSLPKEAPKDDRLWQRLAREIYPEVRAQAPRLGKPGWIKIKTPWSGWVSVSTHWLAQEKAENAPGDLSGWGSARERITADGNRMVELTLDPRLMDIPTPLAREAVDSFLQSVLAPQAVPTPSEALVSALQARLQRHLITKTFPAKNLVLDLEEGTLPFQTSLDATRVVQAVVDYLNSETVPSSRPTLILVSDHLEDADYMAAAQVLTAAAELGWDVKFNAKVTSPSDWAELDLPQNAWGITLGAGSIGLRAHGRGSLDAPLVNALNLRLSRTTEAQLASIGLTKSFVLDPSNRLELTKKGANTEPQSPVSSSSQDLFVNVLSRQDIQRAIRTLSLELEPTDVGSSETVMILAGDADGFKSGQFSAAEAALREARSRGWAVRAIHQATAVSDLGQEEQMPPDALIVHVGAQGLRILPRGRVSLPDTLRDTLGHFRPQIPTGIRVATFVLFLTIFGLFAVAVAGTSLELFQFTLDLQNSYLLSMVTNHITSFFLRSVAGLLASLVALVPVMFMSYGIYQFHDSFRRAVLSKIQVAGDPPAFRETEYLQLADFHLKVDKNNFNTINLAMTQSDGTLRFSHRGLAYAFGLAKQSLGLRALSRLTGGRMSVQTLARWRLLVFVLTEVQLDRLDRILAHVRWGPFDLFFAKAYRYNVLFYLALFRPLISLMLVLQSFRFLVFPSASALGPQRVSLPLPRPLDRGQYRLMRGVVETPNLGGGGSSADGWVPSPCGGLEEGKIPGRLPGFRSRGAAP